MSTYQSRKNVVSRFGLSQKSLLATSALTAAGLIGFGVPAHAVDDHAVWSVGHYEGGTSAQVTGASQGYVQYTADTDRVIAVLDQKHIGALGHVDIKAALWVAKGTGVDPMQILGKLTSNGQLLVIDGNGVFFGPGSRVDAAGLIATTGDISNAQILNNNFGDYEINGASSGAIENHGMINVSEAGLAAFVAPTVRNAGVINAKLGKVVMASGEKVTLDLYGDGLFEVAVEGELSDALIDNTGTINAEGGSVNMTAAAAKDAVDNIINVSGVVNVSSATQEGGKIVLSGGNKGTVKVDGKLLASGKTGGGSVEVKGQNIQVADTSEINVSAKETGNGGQALVIAQDHTDFRGSIYGRGGAVSGNGGFSEVSGYGTLGFSGYVDMGADNGQIGSLLLDPTFAVIHSGLIHNPLGLGYVLSAQALANSMRNTGIIVSATNFIDVGTSLSAYNSGNVVIDAILNGLVGTGNIDLSTYDYWNFTSPFHHVGTTNGGITLRAATVNFNKDLKMGNGAVDVQANTINLNSKIFDVANNLLGDARLTSTAGVVNVLSSNAKIQQGLDLLDDNGTVNVSNGTYTENLFINDSGVKLQSVNGRDSTTIQGTAGVGALGTVVIGNNANGVQLGDTNKGFTVVGFDNGAPGIENAAVYFQGNHAGATVKGNRITAVGDEALVTEYNLNNSDFVIDGNIFDGTTYTGPSGAWGVGNQFTVPNVPRQLVALNRGLSNIAFTNNEVVGDSGNRQLVAIESVGANISGNTFDGETNSAALHVRGSNIAVADNTFTGNGSGVGIYATGVNNLTIGGADEEDGNTVSGFINGILVDGASGTTLVQNNTATGNTDTPSGRAFSDWQTGIGIFLKGVTGTVDVLDNTLTGNTDGIRVQDMDPATRGDVTVARNTASNNQDKGIILKRSDNIEVYNNTVNNNAIGIYADASSNALIKANDINDSTAAGIRLRDGSNGVDIENNWIHGSPIGVHVDNSLANVSGVTIYDNSFAEANGSQSNVKNIVNGSASIVNASFNWFGSVVEAAVAGKITGAVDISPYQGQGVDQQPGTPGYQGNLDDLYVTDAGSQTTGLIQEAVDLAREDGHVRVNAGSYTENLMLDFEGLKLEGLDGATLNYQVANTGRGVTGNLITVTADDVNIDPFVFNGGGVANYGINATGADGLIVDGNTFQGFLLSSIKLSDSNNVRIFLNTITGGQKGVEGDDTINIQVFDNTINGTTVAGIHIANSNGTGYGGGGNDVDIWGNTVASATGTGILIDNSNFATVGPHPTNPFASGLTGGNKISGGDRGIVINGSNNAYVAFNTINSVNGHAVTLANGTNGQILSNVIGTTGGVDNINGDGILANTANGVVISRNTIHETTGPGAIEILNTNGATVGGALLADGNTIRNSNNDGVRLQKNSNITVQNNDIDTTGRVGIWGGNVNTANILNNIVKNDLLGDYGSIHADGGSNWTITGNDVDGGDIGIKLNGTGGTNKIDANYVDNVTGDAIAAINVSGLTISGNFVGTDGGNVGGNGIFVDPSNVAQLFDNIITNVAGNGIYSLNNDDATIYRNTITGAGKDGILVEGGNNVTVGGAALAQGNIIKNSGDDAIDVRGTTGLVTVKYNQIDGTGYNPSYYNGSGAGHNGIEITNLIDATKDIVDHNDIKNAGNNGIEIISSVGTQVTYNTIDNSAFDGISTEEGSGLLLNNNTITGSKSSGIAVHNTTNAIVSVNTISNSNLLGIYGQGTNGIQVLNNIVTNSGTAVSTGDKYGHGIGIESANGVTITGNKVTTSKSSGISVGQSINNGSAGSTNVTVDNNIVSGAGVDGIVIDGGAVSVSENTVGTTGDDGIDVRNSANIQIVRNHVGYTEPTTGNWVVGANNNIGGDGITVVDSGSADILGNLVTQAVGNGIFLDPSDGSVIAGNTILNVDANGIYSLGNSNVTIGGTNNTTGRNYITGTGQNGIKVEGGSDNTVQNNVINTTGVLGNATGLTGNGIYVLNSASADVLGNFVGYRKPNSGTTPVVVNDSILGDGILLVNADGTSGNKTNVKGNKIAETVSTKVNSGSGVQVLDSDHVQVGGSGNDSNTIFNTGWDGVRVAGGSNVVVDNNNIDNVTRTGIYFGGVANGTIKRNDIDGAATHYGIHVNSGSNIMIDDNNVDTTNLDGIFAEYVTSPLTIQKNAVGTNGGNNNIKGNGIYVSHSNNAAIYDNDVTQTVLHGIKVNPSSYVDISYNDIWNVDWDGINVLGGTHVDIWENDIDNTGGDGIDVSGNSDAEIWSNEIDDVVDAGIELTNTDRVWVYRNNIDDADTGIRLNDSGTSGAEIDNNDITDVEYGIWAKDVSNLVITDNDIDGSTRSGDGEIGIYVEDSFNAQIGGWNDGNEVEDFETGIRVIDSASADVEYNDVSEFEDYGIWVSNSEYVDVKNNDVYDGEGTGIRVFSSNDAEINDNDVWDVDGHGIELVNSHNVDILRNEIAGVGDNGIQVDRSFAVDVIDNNVGFAGNDGIHVERSAFADIRDNFVAFVFGDGIDVERSFGTEITGNTVRFAADNGIELQGSDNSVIDNNNVRFVGANGIYVNPSNNVTISNNTINDTLDDGIDVNGGNAITITNNLIGTLSGNIGDDGIDVEGSSDVTISNNQITDVTDAGIELTDTDGVNILFNDIYENGNYGLWARGGNVGTIVLSGNTFTDTRVGARFESGAIDLTDLENPNSFIFTPTFLGNSESPVIGMQFAKPQIEETEGSEFSKVASFADLTIVGETLGSTIFTGFIDRPVGESYYVRFEDGAILDAGGSVITIDGTLASWDGIVPATFPGLILPLATLNAIEDRLFDADDAAINGRGQIFVGFPPLLGLDNVEDFFNRFGNFGTGPSGLNLTITGLPRLTPGALNLGAITPFAGGEEGVAGIEPAAGEESGQGQALDSIEPASGGNDAACWGDALNAAVNGSVSYNFTGDMEEMMNDASSCGTVVGSL
jgi:parallel beta-helix repeat protein